ncbi:MAG: hypothetical protein QOJ12_143 [Thermoleophilales bacterium]|nr:hypothetical protein [Thermoleophilales bacterium]
MRVLAGALLLAIAVAGAVAVAPGAGDTARQQPVLVRLSDRGPAFLNYDGKPTLRADQRDWGVSLVFTGNATIAKVKRALRKGGLTRYGNIEYLAYQVDGATLRFDGDGGLKGRCDSNKSDIHVRLYAPTITGHFVDPQFGSVVIGTTHVDHADGCGSPPKSFGFSEDAEQRVADLLVRQGLHVQPNALTVNNAEPYRRDVEDPAHIWWSDGRATLVEVP